MSILFWGFICLLGLLFVIGLFCESDEDARKRRAEILREHQERMKAWEAEQDAMWGRK